MLGIQVALYGKPDSKIAEATSEMQQCWGEEGRGREESTCMVGLKDCCLPGKMQSLQCVAEFESCEAAFRYTKCIRQRPDVMDDAGNFVLGPG